MKLFIQTDYFHTYDTGRACSNSVANSSVPGNLNTGLLLPFSFKKEKKQEVN